MLALSSLTSLLLPLLLLLLRRRLGCGQPRCVTLFSALAAPPAHLLAAGLLLICSAYASVAVWSSKTKVFLWRDRRPFHRCSLHLSLSPFHLLLLSLLLRRDGAGEGSGGLFVARELQRPKQLYLRQSRTTPQGQKSKKRVRKESIPQSNRRAKNVSCGVL